MACNIYRYMCRYIFVFTSAEGIGNEIIYRSQGYINYHLHDKICCQGMRIITYIMDNNDNLNVKRTPDNAN